MKRLSLLFALSIVLLSFGLANAQPYKVDFNVDLGPGSMFTYPSTTDDYAKGGMPVYIGIQMANQTLVTVPPTGEYLSGWGMGLTVYSVPSGATVVWTDMGEAPVASIERLNTWEDGGIWSGMNDITLPGANWDGNLPDNFRHDCLGAFTPTGGFPPSDNVLLDRFRLHLMVPVTGSDPLTDIVEICVDYTPVDWLFPDGDPFGGPYCFEFLGVPDLPPETEDPDLSQSVEHDVAFGVTLAVTDAEGGTITGVGAVDENDNPLGTANYVGGNLVWTYDPPCDWVTDGESHTVKFYAEEAGPGHVYPGVDFTSTMSLTVTNTAPVIAGDCDANIVAGIEADTYANFTSTDANVGDVAVWSYTVSPSAPAGTVDLTGGVLTFNPAVADETVGFFTFTVTVTDCAGDYDECDVTFEVISQLPFFIVIEAEDGDAGLGVYLGHHAYVDVTQEQGSENNLGFDFLIAYDNSVLAFMGAYGNPVLFSSTGDYQWEYFTYRFVDNCGGSCPSGMLQVVGIADQNDGLHHPIETILPEDFVLFTMDFMVTNDYTMDCSFVPISFFWRDCSDNSIALNYRSDPTGLVILQAISRNVFGYNGTYFPITNPLYGFPTYFGAQEDCDNDDPLKGNDQFIDFFNGGIKIICSDSIDARGDINLNGVLNEIADAVTFTNYFIYGIGAFTINAEGQKAATDVNADGIPLSVADLVYLIRVIVGDVLPIDKLNPNMVEANFAHDGQLVSVDVELGAALFVLEGNVDVSLAQDAAHMQIMSDVVDGNTRVLIYSYDKGASVNGNILNTTGNVISIEAADYN
ncbi:hypothetical protein, partial [Neptuniibacter sp.]|uniref:hypothetical protein n=1 Tax=Neptuniibacter sp. TaxID=1962643 RepID=UPI0026375D59